MRRAFVGMLLLIKFRCFIKTLLDIFNQRRIIRRRPDTHAYKQAKESNQKKSYGSYARAHRQRIQMIIIIISFVALYMTRIIKMSADDKLCKLISSNRDEHTHYALIKGTLSPVFLMELTARQAR